RCPAQEVLHPLRHARRPPHARLLVQQPLPPQGPTVLPARRASLARAGPARRRPSPAARDLVTAAPEARRADIDALRQLIVEAAPDPPLAEPVLHCDPDTVLDMLIPFSSVIVLGVIVAVEDAYGIQVTKPMIAQALTGGATLHRLAQMIT